MALKDFNEDEVLAFAHLAVDKPFQVRFIELMPVGQASSDCSDDYLPAGQVIQKISSHYELEPLAGKKNKSDGPAKIFKIKGGCGEIGFINPVSSHFCATCNRLRLTADGKLRACLLKDEERLKKSTA